MTVVVVVVDFVVVVVDFAEVVVVTMMTGVKAMGVKMFPSPMIDHDA